jgi:hypothetical protein
VNQESDELRLLRCKPKHVRFRGMKRWNGQGGCRTSQSEPEAKHTARGPELADRMRASVLAIHIAAFVRCQHRKARDAGSLGTPEHHPNRHVTRPSFDAGQWQRGRALLNGPGRASMESGYE